MPEAPLPRPLAAGPADAATPVQHIYIACPWTPVGGGMFKVADYLIQAQGRPAEGDAQLLPLDTRGAGSASGSLLVLAGALGRLVRGRLSGQVCGVHVNMAERLSLVRKAVVVATCRALGLPVVLHLHAAQLHHAYRSFSPATKALVRWVFSLPNACIVLGRASADFVTGELGVPPERIEVVINGVPEPSLPRRVPGPLKHLLFVGNLSERKGVSTLLEALARPELARLPLQVHIAGGGDVAGYQAMADRLGLSLRVRFEGWADQARVAQLLAASDALVLPSHDEGLPLAILEALAHGVAVVCTPVGEIPHVLADGRDACFVEPGNAASVAAGLARVLEDDAFRETLEHNGRALFAQRFSLPHFFAQVAAVHRRHFGSAARLAAGEPPAAERRP